MEIDFKSQSQVRKKIMDSNYFPKEKEILEYKIVSARTILELESLVNEQIKLGFVPCKVGYIPPPSIDFHYQTMCRYKQLFPLVFR